jgi:anti-sigma factor RsiW
MQCPVEHDETAGVLLDYVARRLEPDRLSVLESHVATCSRCAEFTLGHEQVWQALDRWEPPPVSRDFNQRLFRRIDQVTAIPWYQGLFEFRVRMKLAIPVAATCLLAAAGFVFEHPSESRASGALYLDGSQADQLEAALDDLQLLRQLDSAAVSEQE